jgi:hypothetical protein
MIFDIFSQKNWQKLCFSLLTAGYIDRKGTKHCFLRKTATFRRELPKIAENGNHM